jgi:hypothetical protein
MTEDTEVVEKKAPFEEQMKRISMLLTGDEVGLNPEQYDSVVAILYEVYLHGRNEESALGGEANKSPGL